MKRQVIAALLIGMAITVTGCSGSTNKETTAATEAQSETAGSEAAQADSETAGAETEETEATPERPDYRALDYVTLGEYKGLEVTLQSAEVTEEEIDSEVAANLNSNDKLEEVTEGVVEDGDVANIDYEGKLDGEAFDGGTDKGYDLTIGSGTFIEGFEEGLVGKNIGDTVDLNLTFPENYGSTDLAGKDVVFTVTINSVKRAPELTDKLAAEISDYETADEYRQSIKDSLAEQKVSEQESTMINDLVGLAYENATVNDYPQEMIDYQLEVVTKYYQSYAEQYGMEYADFLEQQIGMTEDAFLEKMTETVKQSLAQEMVLRAIAETENVEVSDEKFRTKSEEYANSIGMTDVDEFINQYGENEIMASILQDEAVEILQSNAVIKNPDGTLAESESGDTETDAESESAAE